MLRRFQIPFTYLTNCRLNDPVFERGVKDFLAVCNVVKTFKNIRILQISTRPFDFWTTTVSYTHLTSHKSFDYLIQKYQLKMEDRYIIYTKDLKYQDGILYLPIYMTMLI